MNGGNPFDHPFLTVYKSSAVPPGQGVRFGDKIFLNPATAHKLWEQAMSNDKYEATFGPTPTPSKREVKRAARKAKTKALPPVAKWGAVFVLLAVVFGIVYGCSSAVREGERYDQCIQKIAQEDGHEQAVLAEREGECD